MIDGGMDEWLYSYLLHAIMCEYINALLYTLSNTGELLRVCLHEKQHVRCLSQQHVDLTFVQGISHRGSDFLSMADTIITASTTIRMTPTSTGTTPGNQTHFCKRFRQTYIES